MLRSLAILSATALLLASSGAIAAPGGGNSTFAPKLQMLGKNRPFLLSDLPHGRVRDRIESLSWVNRNRALEWLHRFDFPKKDLDAMVVDDEGAVLYVDPAPVVCEGTQCADPSAPRVAPLEPATFPTNTPLSAAAADDAFLLHSRPGSQNVVYLDFNGHSFANTAWGNEAYDAAAFDLDGNPSNFNADERARIAEIWHRVAEDFAPFDIDVTTEEPPSFGPYTGHLLITSSTQDNGDPMPYDNAGGVAYIDVWGRSNYASYYSPALVYYDNLAGSPTYIAEATSHEFGHNLGLSHDGTSSVSYYAGHGSGGTSWAPIMGNSYNRNVTQWSKGEYADANNDQDDIAIITDALFLAGDDHGNTPASATPLLIGSGGEIPVTDPETDPHNLNPLNKGVIDSVSDWDYFAFYTSGGPVDVTVRPAWQAFYRDTRRGSNLDIRARLLDDGGNIVVEADPASDTFATISTTVPAGGYFLAVTGVGNGSSSSYASQGQYFISGTVSSAPNSPPTAAFDFACQALDCSFVDSSADSDGSIAARSWNFGDSATSSVQNPSHSYATEGSYTVTLTVTDNDGSTDAISQTVTVTSGGSADIELIVDNQDMNTQKTGTWSQSSGKNPWDGQSVYNNGGSTFRWLPAIPESGRYQVYAWWTYHANRSSAVPYRIGHDGGVSTVTVNQHDPAIGGKWVSLGEYDFSAGAGYVEVSSENGQASADAVRLLKNGGT